VPVITLLAEELDLAAVAEFTVSMLAIGAEQLNLVVAFERPVPVPACRIPESFPRPLSFRGKSCCVCPLDEFSPRFAPCQRLSGRKRSLCVSGGTGLGVDQGALAHDE